MPIETIATGLQAAYYGYKLTDEIYNIYKKYATVKFEKENIILEFYLIINFKREFQPRVTDLDDGLRNHLRQYDFDNRDNSIKLKINGMEFRGHIWYWMYTERILNMDYLTEPEFYEPEEEELLDENVANDLTALLLPNISELDKEKRKEALLAAKNFLQDLANKIQYEFMVEKSIIKLKIKSDEEETIERLIKKIKDELELTDAQIKGPEKNIDEIVIVDVWNVDASFIDALSNVLFKKSLLRRR